MKNKTQIHIHENILDLKRVCIGASKIGKT